MCFEGQVGLVAQRRSFARSTRDPGSEANHRKSTCEKYLLNALLELFLAYGIKPIPVKFRVSVLFWRN